ncbi:glycosyltransferase family 4 protein [Roseateles sp. BYS87W]|uniref:Glycosyltransferase family 4 protein n=1 Tax=Pelomonas baiyunensis TaxID=3299026 RepID=A0ABW7H3L9_9BURK
MNVIICPEFYGVHGIARYVQSYLAARPADAPRVCLIAADEEVRDMGFTNVDFVHLPKPPGRLGLIRWSLALRRELKRMAAAGQVTVMNLHIPPLLPGLFIPAVAPLVVTAHTTYLGMSGQFYEPRQFEGQWPWISVAIKKWFEHIIFGKASLLLTLTEQGRQELLRYRQDKRIELVPNGVAADRFTPDPSVVKDVDVLFAGRIERRKGSRPMVEVCKALVAAKPDIRISIVGYGDDMDHVTAELAPLAPAVTLHGKVPFAEVLQHYRRSKVYASTSYYEGLPGTCLEAMAVGLPAVVWDYLFYEHVVIQGKSGCRVPPNNIQEFVLRVLDFVGAADACKAFGETGMQIAQSKFNWRAIAASLDGLMSLADDS